MTIGDVISRIRNTIKGVNEDAFLTDRYIYSLYNNFGKQLMKDESDKNPSQSNAIESLYENVPCTDLIDVDKIEACCSGIKTNCTIKRTKDKLPKILEGANGLYLQSVTSIDGSFIVYKTDPNTYTRMTNIPNHKYNKNKYYWYLAGHLYFPNAEWDAATVRAIWSDSIEALVCDGNTCKSKQDDPSPFPEYLSARAEDMVLAKLGVLVQLPQPMGEDSQSPLRSN